MLKLQTIGNTLLVASVLGVLGWVGYENVRSRNEFNQVGRHDAVRPIPGSRQRTIPQPPGQGGERHELLLSETQKILPLGAPPTSQLRIQFSDTEWETLRKRADECGMPIVSFVREVLLNSDCPPARS